MFLKRRVNLARLLGKLFGQGKHRRLVGRERRVQAHDDARVLFVDGFFVICVAQESKRNPVRAERRLDDIRDIACVVRRVKVFQALARMVLVLHQVVVRAVGNAPKLAPAEREEELDVGRCLGIEGKLFLCVVAQAQIFLFQAKRQQPVFAEILPVIEPV